MLDQAKITRPAMATVKDGTQACEDRPGLVLNIRKEVDVCLGHRSAALAIRRHQAAFAASASEHAAVIKVTFVTGKGR